MGQRFDGYNPAVTTTPSDRLTDRLSRLRSAWRRTLRDAADATIIEAIAVVGDLWRPHKSPWRERAAADGSPFPFPMVEPALDAMLDGWTIEALASWMRRQCPNNATSEPHTGVWRSGAPVSAHILAANTPLLGWETIAIALLARSCPFVKLSSRAATWTPLFVESLRQAAPDFADCVDYDEWEGDSAESEELVANADCVVAYGSDATIARLRSLTPPATQFYGYPHRFSIAVIPTNTVGDGVAMGRLAEDCVRFRQLGCLSPQLVFCEGDYRRFANALADAIGTESTRFPLSVQFGQAVSIQRERDAARFLSTEQWGDPGLTWTVIASLEPLWDVIGVLGFTNVIGVHSMSDVPGLFGRKACRLQAMGYAGPLTLDLLGLARALQPPRVCPVGTMQTPPFGWFDDGQSLFHALSRWTEVER